MYSGRRYQVSVVSLRAGFCIQISDDEECKPSHDTRPKNGRLRQTFIEMFTPTTSLSCKVNSFSQMWGPALVPQREGEAEKKTSPSNNIPTPKTPPSLSPPACLVPPLRTVCAFGRQPRYTVNLPMGEMSPIDLIKPSKSR